MNKKGFTLVELIAVVAILLLLTLIATPKLINIINNSRNKGYIEIERRLEEAVSKYIMDIYTNSETDVINVTKQDLIDSSYIENIYDLKDKSECDATIYVYNINADIELKVKLDCKNYHSTVDLVPFSIQINGGNPNKEYETHYIVGSKVQLVNPIKDFAEFKGWQIVKGNSTIQDNILTIGDTETILYADWDNYPKLTVNLDGGSDNVDYKEAYKSETIIPLEKPTKAGYKFTGWVIAQGNSIVSGDNLIMGSEDTIVKATWEVAIPQAIYSATDNSLTFINTELQTKGGTYNGKEVTEVYTGFETMVYTYYGNVPWYSYRKSIKKVEVLDEISPISTHGWFYGMENCDSINLNNLDTSSVTNMEYMFNYAGNNSTVYTLDLGDKFDTSNVTNMSNMFSYTGYKNTKFTLDLGDKFDTSSVTAMVSMFSGTGYNSTVYTLDLGDKFDTSNVTNMRNMFSYAGYNSTVFTLDLGDKFDTSNVTNMSNMFSGTGYSSPVYTLDLGDKFDTSSVTNMAYMFDCAGNNSTVFTLDLGDKFNTSNVTNMGHMFSYTGYKNTKFTLDLGDKFDTSSVTTMQNMFYGTGRSSAVFTLDLGDKFDTSSVTNMQNMFYQTGNSSTVFTLDLGDKFDTSSVTNMYRMFSSTGHSSPVFTLDLGDKFDTSSVTNMEAMFSSTGYNSTVFTLDLGDKFDTSSVTNMYMMFYGTGRSSVVFTLDLGENFDTNNVTNMSYMFGYVGFDSTNFTLDLGDKFKFKDGVATSYFANSSGAKKLIIPATVTNIPSGAFEGMYKLTEIVFEHSVTDTITLPTAGSDTGAFYNGSNINTTVTTTNGTIKNYDWASDNRTVTFIEGE